MTTRIDGLEQRGLVEGQPSDSDGRSIGDRLSAAGLQLIDAAMRTRLDDAAEAMRAVAQTERRQLADSLRRMLIDLER